MELAARMAEKIRELYPGCPPAEARLIAKHTAVCGSGRVGRSAAGRALDDHAIGLAVAAYVRHRHTRYDELLMSGRERAARAQRGKRWMRRWIAGVDCRAARNAQPSAARLASRSVLHR